MFLPFLPLPTSMHQKGKIQFSTGTDAPADQFSKYKITVCLHWLCVNTNWGFNQQGYAAEKSK